MEIEELIAMCASQQVSLAVNDGQLDVFFDNPPDAQLIALLRAHKQDLLEFISAQQVVTADEALIEVVARDDQPLPLSYAQQRLWLLTQIDEGTSHYNMPGALGLTGQLNRHALQQAFNSIVQRHESLRTCFVSGDDGQPQQIIHPPRALPIPVTDLSSLPTDEAKMQLAQRVSREAADGFDLTADLMLRVQLIKMALGEYVLLVTLHHIASDGWSMRIVINELAALYSAYVAGSPNPLSELTIQYADYAHWQRNWLQGNVLKAQLAYWQQQLADLPVVHNLPLDNIRPHEQTYHGCNYTSQVNAFHTDRLKAMCHDTQATLFMGLHAVFSVLLARYSNETDIVMGSPIANREQTQVTELIGFFINTLVLRADLFDNPSFEQLLAQSKNTLLDAYAHQQVSFEQIVEILKPPRSLSHSPLFQVMLVLQNQEKGTLVLPELDLSVVESDDSVAKYDLRLNISETEQGLNLTWNYNTDLFAPKTISAMAEHFDTLLGSLMATPKQGVLSVLMLSQQQIRQQLLQYNDTAVDFDKNHCVGQLIEQQVAQTPTAVAVVFEQQQLSFAELNCRANQLAAVLVNERGIVADMLVGLCLERSLDMVVAIVAILKAGGAYVPLDPQLPKTRLAFMIEDGELDTVITHNQWLLSCELDPQKALVLDDETTVKRLEQQPTDNLCVALNSSHLAYMIYTSGSTGQPKGVLVEHQALVNRIQWMHRQYGATPSDRILQKTPFNFDVSVWEFIWPLTCGATMVVAKPGGHQDPAYLIDLVNQQKISKLHFVPSMLSSLLNQPKLAQCDSIKQLFCSGEALQPEQVQKWQAVLPAAQMHNLYGPTEAAIDVSYFDCRQAGKQSVAIGQPIDNIQLLVLTPQLELTPQGVPGELYIGGVGLARGYLKRQSLTEQCFIDNPFEAQIGGARLYKTGDLVRRGDNGDLHYFGRIDHQVKISGLRIELGEIEYQIIQHTGVQTAIVLSTQDGAGHQRLVAYVQPCQQQPVAFDGEFRSWLQQSLPQYMVPSLFVEVAHWPLTANGKVDRKALLAMDSDPLHGEYHAPETEAQKALVTIWAELLHLPEQRISINANFFDLGGHSLLLINFITLVKARLNEDLSVKKVFALKDIQSIAQVIDLNRLQRDAAQKVSEDDDIMELVI